MSHLENRKIARNMLETIPMIMGVVVSQMRATDNTMSEAHVPVLGVLHNRPHTLSELAERMHVTAPTMSNTITTLEDRGWVTRRRSEKDRRIVWVEITHTGINVLQAMTEELEVRLGHFFDALDEDQRQQVFDGLNVLWEVFRKAGGYDERDAHVRDAHVRDQHVRHEPIHDENARE